MRLALLTLLAAFPAAYPQVSDRDPAFAKIPFERWLSEREQAHFQWRARVGRVELGNPQRLRARVEVSVDGRELARRMGAGQLVLFVQVRDAAGDLVQNHAVMALRDANPAAAKSDFVYSQDFLVLPGEYHADIGILDTNTGEHATLQRDFRADALHGDPFPDSWRGLPRIERVENADPPDGWYQPQLAGPLRLPVETRRPLRVEVLLNVWPVPENPRRRTLQSTNRGLEELLPAFKVLSQMALSQGSLELAVLDLARRKVVFTQEGSGPPDWQRLRPALLQADPNTIDVRDLAGAGESAQFLVEQIRKRLAKQPPPVLILLTDPLRFAEGEDLHPIEIAGAPAARVFVFRFHTSRPRPFPAGMAPGMGRRGGFPRMGSVPAIPDALEPLLKPLHPRIFDVLSPLDFRKALGQVAGELGRM